MRLDVYIRSLGMTPWQFAKENKIPFMTLSRVLEGRWVSMRTADRIVRATRGEVRLEDLVPARKKTSKSAGR